MSYLADRERALSERYLSYMSESAHGNRARKLEKKRKELIAEIRKSIGDAGRLRPFKGDASLRDAYRTYWDILLKVFNEDFEKIVDMEAIAEESYDNMEAYLLAHERAGDVLDAAHQQIEPVFKAFAENNNITLIETESKMDRKLKQVVEVNAYYHQLFLIFFKSFKQEVYTTEAFNRKDINAVEQNRGTLAKYAVEGLGKLDNIQPYKGDASILNACRRVLEFHRDEADKHFPVHSEFLVRQDEFDKIRKAFEVKPAASRTQADVDQYNKSINEFNKILTNTNKSLEVLNRDRQKVMSNWETASGRFMEAHVPRSR
jgi:hypothetical protein